MARTVKTDAPIVADTVLRLAVLLQAGVAPARAWAHLAGSGDPVAVRVSAALAGGLALPDAIAASGERMLAAAWRVASTVGAPLAECLRGLATAMRDTQETADEVRVALAEPAATAKLMAWLPLVAVLLGVALGFDTFGVLFSHPVGIACVVAGGALIVVAQHWTALLVKRARSAGDVPGMHAELLAIALSGGVSIERARAIVTAATVPARPDSSPTDAAADPPAPTGDPAATHVESQQVDTDAVLALSRDAGVPAVELLRASAALARHRARIDGRLRAARLSSRLLLPLGVCTLPAFLLLGVAPMLLSVMAAAPMQF